MVGLLEIDYHRTAFLSTAPGKFSVPNKLSILGLTNSYYEYMFIDTPAGYLTGDSLPGGSGSRPLNQLQGNDGKGRWH